MCTLNILSSFTARSIIASNSLSSVIVTSMGSILPPFHGIIFKPASVLITLYCSLVVQVVMSHEIISLYTTTATMVVLWVGGGDYPTAHPASKRNGSLG